MHPASTATTETASASRKRRCRRWRQRPAARAAGSTASGDRHLAQPLPCLPVVAADGGHDAPDVHLLPRTVLLAQVEQFAATQANRAMWGRDRRPDGLLPRPAVVVAAHDPRTQVRLDQFVSPRDLRSRGENGIVTN
jgi:hypothetical protein